MFIGKIINVLKSRRKNKVFPNLIWPKYGNDIFANGYSSRDIFANNLKLEGLNTCFQNLEGKTTRVLKFTKQNKLSLIN